MPARAENLILCDAALVGGSMEIGPDELQRMLRASANAGFGGVSLWALHHRAVVAAGMSDDEVRALHKDLGLSTPVVESLFGWEGGDPDAIDAQWSGLLDLAASYGACTIGSVVLAPKLDSFDAAAAGFAHLAGRAQERGLGVCLEWLPWTGVPDLKTAWKLVQATGLANTGLVLDTWHWQRQPGGPDLETLRTIPGERIHCVQLNDTTREGTGEEIMVETMTKRLLPGDGEVDYAALLAVLEEIGADPIWAPEVFNAELVALGPDSMALRIAAATRNLLGL